MPNFTLKVQAIVKILILGPRPFLAFFFSALPPEFYAFDINC